MVFPHLLHSFECEIHIPQATPCPDPLEALRHDILIFPPDGCRPSNDEGKEQTCNFSRIDLVLSRGYPFNSRLNVGI
jgi:hypothetical protein